MRLYVDIDGQLCTLVSSLKYDEAKPILENIKKVNYWFKLGHYVVLWTARGQGSGIDWGDVTRDQLERWGVFYNELCFDKPLFDVFFDDKSRNLNDVCVEDFLYE